MSILTMEAFSLLKIWRNVVSDSTCGEGGVFEVDATKNACEAAYNQAVNVEAEEEESFFELVFSAPDCDGDKQNDTKNVQNVMKFDNDLVKSPKESTGKVRIFPIEPNSKPVSPISLLRSAPKFRIFMFRFGKSKFEKTETDNAPLRRQQQQQASSQSKRFTVKCEVEEIRIASLFTRDRSLRSKLQMESSEEEHATHNSKRSPKDVVHKYMKLIKPLYVKVSRRYTEKVKISDQLSKATPSSSPAMIPRKQTEEKQGCRATGFRVVCKHLGKSRSASSSASGVIQSSATSRRDDSLLQQHDGIQSAILHCKSSYNSRRDCSLLSRSTSDPWHEKSIYPSRFSTEEQKRSSI